MAEDDIYKSKAKYERLISIMDSWVLTPDCYKGRGYRKYYIKYKDNLKYFYKLLPIWEMKDLSYIRRIRLLNVMLMICFVPEKDLKDCNRDDINEIMGFMHTCHKTIKSKSDFIKNLKCLWRVLFPDIDQFGRADETLIPYVVRHLSGKIDKSKQKRRNEKYTIEEFQKIVQFFDKDPKVQAYITAIHETYVRPQELLYLKIQDLEFYDNYGIANVSSHGKEGCKPIQFENLSYPYLCKWYHQHPLKNDPEAYLFLGESNNNRYKQLGISAMNKKISHACKVLGINKRITSYTFKRMGITIDRMNGVLDKIIISKAGWTSGKQLSTYDLGSRKEGLRMSLISKGLVTAESFDEKRFQPKQKHCSFCQYVNAYADNLCGGCHRPLNREHMQEMEQSHQKLMSNELLSRIDKLETALTEKLEESV